MYIGYVVLLCLVVCLILLASFLPSHLSLKREYYTYIVISNYMYDVYIYPHFLCNDRLLFVCESIHGNQSAVQLAQCLGARVAVCYHILHTHTHTHMHTHAHEALNSSVHVAYILQCKDYNHQTSPSRQRSISRKSQSSRP